MVFIRLVGLSFWTIIRHCTMPNHWFRWELSGLRSVCDVWDVREDRWELVRNKHVLKALSAIQWIHPISVCWQLLFQWAHQIIRCPRNVVVNTSLLVLMDRRNVVVHWTVANSGFGATYERYSWSQTLDDVSVIIPVDQHIRGKDIDCRITPTHLYMGIRGEQPILDVVNMLFRIDCRARCTSASKQKTLFGRLIVNVVVVLFALNSIRMEIIFGGSIWLKERRRLTQPKSSLIPLMYLI